MQDLLRPMVNNDIQYTYSVEQAKVVVLYEVLHPLSPLGQHYVLLVCINRHWHMQQILPHRFSSIFWSNHL